MSILTLITDALLLAVLVWLWRRGAMDACRAWIRGSPRGAPPPSQVPLTIRIDGVARLDVEHRETGARWGNLLAGTGDRELGVPGDLLVVRGGPDGSVIVESTVGTSVRIEQGIADDPAAAARGKAAWVVRLVAGAGEKERIG